MVLYTANNRFRLIPRNALFYYIVHVVIIMFLDLVITVAVMTSIHYINDDVITSPILDFVINMIDNDHTFLSTF